MNNGKWLSIRLAVLLIVCTVVCLEVALASSGPAGALAAADSATVGGVTGPAPEVTCPDGQCFADVTSSNGFYANINSLYMDGLVSGYACGGPGEPCDGANRPYYRSGNGVSRQQMAKFVDNGRRNISTAVGVSLHMNNPAGVSLDLTNSSSDSIDVSNSSGNEAIQASCTTAGSNCYAFYGTAAAGTRAGYFSGGRGVRIASDDAGFSAVEATSSSSAQGSYAVSGIANYRGGYIKSNSTTATSLVVDSVANPNGFVPALGVLGGALIDGNLTVTGSKTGYVVDLMQNASGEILEVGDVVTLVGSGPAVWGSIPVVEVKKASTAYDTALVGVVDQVMYVPDVATRTAYEQQQASLKAAMQARTELMAKGSADGGKPDPETIAMPNSESYITDEQGIPHALANVTEAAPGAYVNVVTLGSYKAIKADASYGVIHPGDLLVSSPNAGYAMKGDPSLIKFGSVIGKALDSLESGTGTVGVIVTLK